MPKQQLPLLPWRSDTRVTPAQRHAQRSPGRGCPAPLAGLSTSLSPDAPRMGMMVLDGALAPLLRASPRVNPSALQPLWDSVQSWNCLHQHPGGAAEMQGRSLGWQKLLTPGTITQWTFGKLGMGIRGLQPMVSHPCLSHLLQDHGPSCLRVWDTQRECSHE